MNLDALFHLPPYGLHKKDKDNILAEILNERTRRHYASCPEYARVLDILGYDIHKPYDCAELPFLPVRLFKEFELCSVAKDQITKTLTSSGTSGHQVSKIFLDAENVRAQSKALNEIISSFIGKQRLPMLLLDTEMIKKDRAMYSARGAGIIGFSIFGRNSVYALDANMNLDIAQLTAFFEKYQDVPILMFGYTYMIWQFIVRVLEEKNIAFHSSNAVLFHIGGWKKLKNQSVDAQEFNQRVKARFGDVKVYNYYGMVEQLGSVFVECEYGCMHCSNYSDIIIRRAKDFSVANIQEKGLIELLSVLPTSYPGHVLLTEDEGEILGIDDCPCGRKGKYFKIHGRIKNAELRGCSDTYEQS